MKHVSPPPSPLSSLPRYKRQQFSLRRNTRRLFHSPLEDIPQKTLIRRSVDVRGGSVRTVTRHFKENALSKLCKKDRETAFPPAVVSLLSGFSQTPPPDVHVTACPHRGGANHSLPIPRVTSHLPPFQLSKNSHCNTQATKSELKNKK